MDNVKTLIRAIHPSLREDYKPQRERYGRRENFGFGDIMSGIGSAVGGVLGGVGSAIGGILGTGGAGAKSTVNSSSLNDTLTSIMSDTVQSCAGNATQSQTISQSGSYNIMSGVSQTQALYFSLTCSQGGSTTDNVVDKLTNAIQAHADATGQVIDMGKQDADVTTSIKNSVKTTVNDSSMQEMMASLNQAQGVDQSGNHNIMTNITQDQTAKMIADQSANMVNQIGVVQQLNAQTDSGATATEEGLGAIFGNLMYIAIAGILIGAFFFYKIFIDSGSSSGSTTITMAPPRPPPPPQYPQYPPQYPPPPQYAPQAAPQAPPQYAPQAPPQAIPQAPPQASPQAPPPPAQSYAPVPQAPAPPAQSYAPVPQAPPMGTA